MTAQESSWESEADKLLGDCGGEGGWRRRFAVVIFLTERERDREEEE